MTAIALIDQQYKKLFADLYASFSSDDPIKSIFAGWGIKRQLMGFAYAHGLPTMAFFENVGKSGDIRDRQLALELLHSPDADVTERLLRLFYRPEERSSSLQFMRLLAQRQITDCEDILLALEANPDSDVRKEAITVRRQLHGQQPWKADFLHTRDKSSGVRYEAYERLASHGQDVPLFIWQQAYEDADDEIRKIAIQQLATHTGDFIDAVMLDAISHKEFVIAKAAREYLKRDPDRFFDHLEGLLPESPAQTACFALDVLCRSKRPEMFALLVQTYDNAKSRDVRNKVMVEMQKNKSAESTRFFLQRSELKPVQSRNLTVFLPELIQLAVAGRYEALPLIVKNGKKQTKAALLAVFEGAIEQSFVRQLALKAYFQAGGELTDAIRALLVQAMTQRNVFDFNGVVNLVAEFNLTPLIEHFQEFAKTCNNQDQLRSIKKLLAQFGEELTSIEVEEAALQDILKGYDNAAIVAALSRATAQDLADHEKTLQNLMYRGDADVRALARKALLALNDAGTREWLGNDVARYTGERTAIAIEHACAIGVDGFVASLTWRAYDQNPDVAALALAALESSQGTRMNVADIRRNAELNRQIKADANVCATQSDATLLALTHDDFCSMGKVAAKALLQRGTVSRRDPQFAYVSILAEAFEHLQACTSDHIESALRQLTGNLFHYNYWPVFENLLFRGAEIQPLCFHLLLEGRRRQQEAAASALKMVANLDYAALLKGPGRKLGALKLVMDVLDTHLGQVKLSDLKDLFDFHCSAFHFRHEEKHDSEYTNEKNGMAALLSARQKAGCPYFLQDAIHYFEQQRINQSYVSEAVVSSIGKVDSKEALLYLLSLLRTNEVAVASWALRDRIGQIERPAEKLIVALFTKQTDKFPAIKNELQTITAEEFAILLQTTRGGSLDKEFLEMCKEIGPVFYRHALNPDTVISENALVLFAEFFSQKPDKETEAFLLHHLQGGAGNVNKKIHCVRGLGKARCHQALPLIESKLEVKDENLQRAAIDALARIGNTDTIIKLKSLQPSLGKKLVGACDKAIDTITKKLQKQA